MNSIEIDDPKTIKLLKIIGSPFVSNHESPSSKEEAIELYYYAMKNKIALAYLESLNKQNKLIDFGLLPQYKDELKKYELQQITLFRVTNILNKLNANYAVFKSIMPFPATPNDVDIIHFGSEKEFDDLTLELAKYNYREISGDVDACQRMFHDLRDGPHPDAHKKDIYDIDIYQKISASFIIYVNKNKISSKIINYKKSQNTFMALSPETELMVMVIHSIIPEMLLTLLIYYATLYYIKEMSDSDITNLVNTSRENNNLFALKTHFTLVAELHRSAHGFVPDGLEKIISSLGENVVERKSLMNAHYHTPYKYSLYAICRVLLEKCKDIEFLISVLKQSFSMLNPKQAKWVISNVIWRRQRNTY